MKRRRTSCCNWQARCLGKPSQFAAFKCTFRRAYARLLVSRLQLSAALCRAPGSRKRESRDANCVLALVAARTLLASRADTRLRALAARDRETISARTL